MQLVVFCFKCIMMYCTWSPKTGRGGVENCLQWNLFKVIDNRRWVWVKSKFLILCQNGSQNVFVCRLSFATKRSINTWHSRGTKLSTDNTKLGANARSYRNVSSMYHVQDLDRSSNVWRGAKTATPLCASDPVSCIMKGSKFPAWHIQNLIGQLLSGFFSLHFFFKESVSICPLRFCPVSCCLRPDRTTVRSLHRKYLHIFCIFRPIHLFISGSTLNY